MIHKLSVSIVLGFALIAGSAAAAEPDLACEATGAAAEVLERVQAHRLDCGLSPACTGEVLAMLEEALAERPDDLLSDLHARRSATPRRRASPSRCSWRATW